MATTKKATLTDFHTVTIYAYSNIERETPKQYFFAKWNKMCKFAV